MTLQPLVSIPFLVLFAILWVGLIWWGFFRSRQRRVTPVSPAASLIGRTLFGAILVTILLGPSVPSHEEELTTNVEIFLAVDRTGSMAAEDWEDDQPRLEGVRRDVRDLVRATGGARYSIVTWDSTARIELPVTTDSSAVTSFADSLHQEISEFSSGSSLNRPVAVLLDTLQDAASSRPQNFRFLIVISDGENTDPDVTGLDAEWASVGSLIDGGAVVGYGTPEGGPMRVFVTGTGPQDEYMEDPDHPGTRAISIMDEAALADLAGQLGLPLLVNPTEAQIEDLGEQLMRDAEEIPDDRNLRQGYRYVVWPFALAATLLLAAEAWVVTGRIVQLRRTHAL